LKCSPAPARCRDLSPPPARRNKKRIACDVSIDKARDKPGRQILRGHAVTCSGEIAIGRKRLIEHRDSGLLDLRFGDQIGAGGNVVQQVKFGENEGAGILSAEKFSCRLKLPNPVVEPG
jgi:hypothetical protein